MGWLRTRCSLGRLSPELPSSLPSFSGSRVGPLLTHPGSSHRKKQLFSKGPQPVSTALTVGGPRAPVSLSPRRLAVMPRPGPATCREEARGWSEPRAWWGGRRVAEPPGAVPEAETVTPISVLVRHVLQTVLCRRHPGPFNSEGKQMRH